MTNSNDVMLKQVELLDKIITNGLETNASGNAANDHKVGDIVLNNIFNGEWLMLDGMTAVSSEMYPELASKFCTLPLVQAINGNYYSIKAK